MVPATESEKNKDLVMGFSTNQDQHSLRLFCRSLRRIYSPEQCDLVIITNRYEDYFSDLAGDGVCFVSTTNTYPGTTHRLGKAFKRIVLEGTRVASRVRLLAEWAPEIAAAYPVVLETWLHPQFARWIAYERFLTLNCAYRQVFLSDVRDVVFQAPLFDHEPGDQVTLFEQDEVYGTAGSDTEWYRSAWGEEALAKVIGKKAVCIGTILGPRHQVLSMVTEFSAFFRRHPYRGVEQSVFNYMLYNDLIRTPYRVVENIKGTVATLANYTAHDATETRDGYVRRATDGTIIPAVHMYDRWPDTKALYAQ
jgi:hypothetical protein